MTLSYNQRSLADMQLSTLASGTCADCRRGRRQSGAREKGIDTHAVRGVVQELGS